MPASIAHMLIARKVREELTEDPYIEDNFVKEILEENSTYMELGALGPDLPYYQSITFLRASYNTVFNRYDKPMGVDQWSYQMHSLNTNEFPLEMIKTIFEDRPFKREPWDSGDKKKLAFICGYLTHMAADQIIHPIINLIAGPYYKEEEARKKHREAEVTQDLYLFNRYKGIDKFKAEQFNLWCDIFRISDDTTLLRFKYLIQRALLETYYVTPPEEDIDHWVKGTLHILSVMNGIGPFGLLASFGPYGRAIKNIVPGSEKYNEFIELNPSQDASPAKKAEYEEKIGSKTYDNFFPFAVELASIYIKTVYRIYKQKDLTLKLEKKFKEIVSDADLGSPLKKNILDVSREAFKHLED